MKYKSCEKCAHSVGQINIAGNILMIVIKGYMGVAGRSTGLIADAIHSCADLLATFVMIIGLNISEKEKNDKYPYGYGKAEYIVAIIIYLFLFLVGVYIIYHAFIAIIDKHQIRPCLSAAWGAIFSIAINELMFRQSVCAGTQINSPSMVAKAWESRSDVYSSIAVLIGIIGAKIGFHFMDPLAAVAVGIIILKICVEMINDSVRQLMDQSPDVEIIDTIYNVINNMDHMIHTKKVMGREVGRSLEFEIYLTVPPDISLEAGEIIKRKTIDLVCKSIERKSIVSVRLVPNIDK